MLADDDLGHLLLFVDDDVFDLRRAECFSDELAGVLPVLDDVHLLAAQFVHHLADPGPAGAHAGTLRIDGGVVADDRDLRSVTRFTSDGDDLDGAVDQLGNFEFEQSTDQVRVAARNDDLGAFALASHFDDHALDPVAALQALVGDSFGSGDDRLGVAQVEDRVAVVDLLHDAGDEVTFPSFVDVEDLLPLGLAQTLGDDLLGGLGSDPTEVVGRVLPLASHVAVLVEFLGVDPNVAGIGVDRDPRLFGRSRAALVGADQGVGQGVEDRVHRYPALAFEQLERFHHLKVDLHAPVLTSCQVSGRLPSGRPSSL